MALRRFQNDNGWRKPQFLVAISLSLVLFFISLALNADNAAKTKMLVLEDMAMTAVSDGRSFVYSTNDQHTPFDEPFKVSVNDQVCAVVYDQDGNVKSDSCQ